MRSRVGCHYCEPPRWIKAAGDWSGRQQSITQCSVASASRRPHLVEWRACMFAARVCYSVFVSCVVDVGPGLMYYCTCAA